MNFVRSLTNFIVSVLASSFTAFIIVSSKPFPEISNKIVFTLVFVIAMAICSLIDFSFSNQNEKKTEEVS